MNNKSRVRLPDEFWEVAQDKEELKHMITNYVNKSYPGYTIIKVKGKFVLCYMNR